MSRAAAVEAFHQTLHELVLSSRADVLPSDVMQCLILEFVTVAHMSGQGLQDIPALLTDTEELIHTAIEVILEA